MSDRRPPGRNNSTCGVCGSPTVEPHPRCENVSRCLGVIAANMGHPPPSETGELWAWRLRKHDPDLLVRAALLMTEAHTFGSWPQIDAILSAYKAVSADRSYGALDAGYQGRKALTDAQARPGGQWLASILTDLTTKLEARREAQEARLVAVRAYTADNAHEIRRRVEAIGVDMPPDPDEPPRRWPADMSAEDAQQALDIVRRSKGHA